MAVSRAKLSLKNWGGHELGLRRFIYKVVTVLHPSSYFALHFVIIQNEYTDDVLLNCTLETDIILLNNVTPINVIKNKTTSK